ncbi:MAG: transposase [Ardenticatenaceae bacterium]|nr:transposase [Ardenticatenaceae bacterium]
MPKPIVCLAAQLREDLEAFRSCFSQRQWSYFVIVLLRLVACEERRPMTGLLRVVGERASLSGLSRFLNKWPWSAAEVAQTWRRRLRNWLEPLVAAEHARLKAEQPKRVGRPKATVVTGDLIFDDSVPVKPKGRTMGGLGRHSSQSEQRVVSGHGLFTSLSVLLGQRCPIEPHLSRQRSVCQAEGAPFQSKVALAVEAIGHFEPVAGTHTHVGSSGVPVSAGGGI